MAEVLQLVKTAWDSINASGQYMGLFLVAFIFLFVVDNKKNRVLFAYCLLALVLVFNPFTANNLLSFCLPDNVYWYAFLLLPVIPVCAYACVEAVSLQEKKIDKWIVSVVLALIAGVAGNFMNDNPSAVAVENRACISQEYLDMFSEMNIEGEPIVLLANDDIMESARAYSTNIGLPYEVTLINQPWEVAQQFYDANLSLVHGQMQNPLNCLGNITAIARKYQCNYLVLPIEADERSAMEHGGYEVLLETEKYVLYHDTEMY